MSPTTVDEMFVDGIREAFYTEHRLYDALEELAAESSNADVADAFSTHRDETREHVLRLEEIFNTLGESVREKEDYAVAGLIEAHDEFRRSDPEQAALDRYTIAAGQKSEHYEIAMYGNLTPLAAELGMDDVADLLEETLREEQEALAKLSRLGEEFDRQHGKPSSP